MPITFLTPRLLQFNSNAVTDHNRSPLAVDLSRIGENKRMVDGSLRTFYVADKRSFSVSWEDVPFESVQTVDGFWGAEDIRDFYEATTGSFTLGVTNKDNTVTNYTVVFTGFSMEVTKRWGQKHLWQISVDLEEV